MAVLFMRMKPAILYIHGRGGSPAESEHYRPLFPGCEVIGLGYRALTPWETGLEIREAVTRLRWEYESLTLIANSIGAYFSLCAGIDGMLRKAYFISPVTDMEGLILRMMAAAHLTEEVLRERGEIPVPSGETLSWRVLCYCRAHPVRWNVPTEILCGEGDALIPFEDTAAFAKAAGAGVTVMKNGEHWFHTEEQMRFLDGWIRQNETEKTGAEAPVS